ncbi:MAG: hypothetical protein RL172_3242 [Bacteroidota bacterium]|jgi:peptidoglycan hydrolase CwlO-like protein
MNTSNIDNMHQQGNKNGQGKNIAIGVLAACLLGLGAYTITDKNKSGEQIQQQQTQIAQVTEEKSDIQKNFDASLARLDSMSTVNTDLQGKLSDKNSEIAKIKGEIRSILNKKNATAAELAKATKLIADLNGRISTMEADIARLTDENKGLNEDKIALTKDKEQLTTDLANTTAIKQDLEQKVDVASTLNASNISVKPINIKKNGKEDISAKAKRVDKLLISFDVDNRIARAGNTDVYVVVMGPDGKLLTPAAAQAATFSTRDEGEKAYTAKVPVSVEPSKKRNVEFGFVPGGNFQQGSYKVMIYQNGFLIGEGKTELKKGGLFG